MLPEEVNMNTKILKWNFCNFSLYSAIVLDILNASIEYSDIHKNLN